MQKAIHNIKQWRYLGEHPDVLTLLSAAERLQEVKKENAVLKSQIENADVNLEQQKLIHEKKFNKLQSLAKQLAEALQTAKNTVECDSTDDFGNELPWYKQAKAALTAAQNQGLIP